MNMNLDKRACNLNQVAKRLTIKAMILVSWLFLVSILMGASARTQNFIVSTNGTPAFAQEAANRFEESRYNLSVYWFGGELRNWSRPVPCQVNITQRPQGGVTTFSGNQIACQVTGDQGWLLKDCIPHETFHMVSHSHIGTIPRWADEGICGIIESDETYNKHTQALVQFLQTGRGITTKRLWSMQEYPQDIMPLYAQGYSQMLFLFQHSGPKDLIRFMRTGADENALRVVYQYDSCAAFQVEWLSWVKAGSPRVIEVFSPCDNGNCQPRRWRGSEWKPLGQNPEQPRPQQPIVNQGDTRPIPWTPPKPLAPVNTQELEDSKKLADCLKHKADLEAKLKDLESKNRDLADKIKTGPPIGSGQADSTINLPLVQAEADRLKRRLDTSEKEKAEIAKQLDEAKTKPSAEEKPGLVDKLKDQLHTGAEFGIDHGWKFLLATVLGLSGWKLWAAYAAGKIARRRIERKIAKRRAKATKSSRPFHGSEGDAKNDTGGSEQETEGALGRSATFGRELIQLHEQEQRNPLHDATFGRVFEQEAELVLESEDEVAKGVVQKLLDRAYRRFANIHPVAIKEQ